MAITLINPNLIAFVMAALIALASPQASVSPFQTSANQSFCQHVQTLTDPQMKSPFTMWCAGSSVALYLIADKIENSQFLFIADQTSDGRTNVAIQWEMAEDFPKLPTCDFGTNYLLTMRIEAPDPTGRRMELKEKCILRIVGAAEMLRMVADRLAQKGISLDNADWQLVHDTTIQILKELAAQTLAR